MISFLRKYIPFALLIAIILFIFGLFEQFKPVMKFAWLCYGVLFVLSLLTYYFSGLAMKKKFGSFMGVYFAGIFAKLIIVAIVVLVFKTGYKGETQDVSFIIPFAIIYFSFLFFETIELVKLSRRSPVPAKKPGESGKPSV
jgi:hypothetical protein